MAVTNGLVVNMVTSVGEVWHWYRVGGIVPGSSDFLGVQCCVHNRSKITMGTSSQSYVDHGGAHVEIQH